LLPSLACPRNMTRLPSLPDRVMPLSPRLPRAVWILTAGRAVNRLGAFTLPFITVALTEEFGASVSAAGALMAMFGAAAMASRVAGGWLADRFGPRSTIVAGLVLTAAAQLGIAASPTLLSAGLAVAGLGLAFEIYEPASQSLIADTVPAAARPAAYGLMSAGLVVAGVAAGLLAFAIGSWNVRLLFVVDAGTCLACALLLALALPHPAAGPAPRGARPDRDPRSSPWRDRRLLALLAVGTAFAAIYLQVDATLALTLAARGIPATRLGLLLTVAAATTAVGQPLLRRGWFARLDPWRALTVGYGLLGLGLLANGFASTLPQFAAATVLWSLGDVLLLGRAYGLAADIAPAERRASYFSVYGLSWGAAAIVGPFAGTQLLTRMGPVRLWGAAAAGCAALALAQPWLRKTVAPRHGGAPVDPQL
jgi:MFS family permease